MRSHLTPCPRRTARTHGGVADDPHLRSRNMVQEIEQEGIGRMLTPGSPIKSDRSDDDIRAAAPALGADTRRVLEELAGWGGDGAGGSSGADGDD